MVECVGEREAQARRPQVAYRWRSLDAMDGKEFSDIVIPECCPVLGIKLELAKGLPGDSSPTLDKIIPELGYVPGNIEVISKLANSMKRNANAWQLFRFCQYYVDKLQRSEQPLPEPVFESVSYFYPDIGKHGLRIIYENT